MRRLALPGAMALLLSVLLVHTAWSESYRVVNIHSHPYQGKTLTVKGRLYLPLQVYARDMGLSLRQQGACWLLNDKAHASGACSADATGGLYVNHVKVPNALVTRSGVVWVDARAVTKALHGRYLPFPSAGTLDIAGAYVAPPPPMVMPTSAPVGLDDGKVVMVHWYATW